MSFVKVLRKSPEDLVNEALVYTKADVSLKKSDINDPHIQRTMKLYADSTGNDFDEVVTRVEAMIDERKESFKGSRMNKNSVENAAEGAMFELIQELKITPEFTEEHFGIKKLIDRNIFFDLTQYVIGENAQFFPLRNPFERKAVKPLFFISPDHLPLIKDPSLRDAAENHCDTAFCTPGAEMVFSRKFMEEMAVQAILNGVKPKSRKYASNGGPIPDHYAYIEFVIMHELLHFSAGDHFYTKEMVEKIAKKHPEISTNSAHLILNYVGDFINNWTLVKSGYEQLPIGLFSEDINYDKFNSYEEIIEAVISEMKQMDPKDRENIENAMSDQMDDHMDNPDDKPSQGGQNSQPQSSSEQGDGDSAQPSQPSQPSQPGSGAGQPGQPGQPGHDPDDIAQKIDQAMKQNQENVNSRNDGNNDADSALNRKGDNSDTSSGDKKGKPGTANTKVEFRDDGSATINWKKLLKKMIPSGDGELEDTYSKMSRSATSSMVTAKQTGMGRVAPGEVMIDSNKRGLVFVIDNSGSVYSQLSKFNKEILMLLKKNKKLLDNMFIAKFSDTYELFKVDVSRMKAKKVNNPNNMEKEKISYGPDFPVLKLFEQTFAAGTKYTPQLHGAVEYLHNKDMNVIMFTDDDLVYDANFNKFVKLAKKRKNSIACMITYDRSLKNMQSKFGRFKWMTVLE